MSSIESTPFLSLINALHRNRIDWSRRPVKTALQIVHSQEGGGVEALAAIVGDGLASAGFSVATATLYPAFHAPFTAKVKGCAHVAWRILTQRPDVLIGYQSTGSVLAGLVGLASGCKYRVVHQTAMPGEINRVVRAIDRLIGALGVYSINIANSEATERAFAGYPLAYRRRMKRIMHGIDMPKSGRNRADVLAGLGLTDDRHLLVHAGRFSTQKAQQNIIAALTLLPRHRLVLVGGGPAESALRKAAAAYEVSDRVHFTGVLARTDVADLVAAADVFVFPSIWETFGLAAVEAAMLGVPIVANDLPVLREVLTGDTGSPAAFVATDDPRAFANAIEAQTSSAAKVSACQFAPHVQRRFSKDRMIANYCALATGADPDFSFDEPLLASPSAAR